MRVQKYTNQPSSLPDKNEQQYHSHVVGVTSVRLSHSSNDVIGVAVIIRRLDFNLVGHLHRHGLCKWVGEGAIAWLASWHVRRDSAS